MPAPAARARAVQVHVINIDHDGLSVGATQRLRTARDATVIRGLTRLSNHDHTLAIQQLGVLYAACFRQNLQTHFEPECTAQPVDGPQRIVIKNCNGYSRPSRRCVFHGAPLR